jgi:hypothetical protein
VANAKKGTVANISELQITLSDAIRNLADGDATAANVNAISNATGKILSTVKLQMMYYQLIGKTPDIPMLMASE